MASGFGGTGYFDEVTGEWVPTFGTNLNSNPVDIPQPRPITTPNSSSGQPAYQSPDAPRWNPEFATPQGGPLTTTPNSRNGAPAPGIRTLPATVPQPGGNPMTMPSAPGAFPMGGSILSGIGALAGAPSTPGEIGKQANKVGSWVDNTPWGKWLIEHRITSPYQKWVTEDTPATQTAPAAASSDPTGSSVTMASPTPPDGGPPLPPIRPPPDKLPPFVRGPIPFNTPAHTPAAKGAKAPKAPANINLGYGAPPAPSPMFTTIDRPNADISGGPTRPGFLSASYDPATGTNRGPREPGGPARMGALDLSGIFNHPAVAQAAAAHPAVQGAMAAGAGAAPVSMGGQHAARAPTMQARWSLPQTRPRGASAVTPTFWNPFYGQGANVGMGN